MRRKLGAAVSVDLSKLVHDRDVVEPFIARLVERLRERHPGITLDDITVSIEVDVRAGNPFDEPARLRFLRMLRDMDKEGVVL